MPVGKAGAMETGQDLTGHRGCCRLGRWHALASWGFEWEGSGMEQRAPDLVVALRDAVRRYAILEAPQGGRRPQELSLSFSFLRN